ncbi:MAG TPA: hypothetical protein VGJ82_01780 [Thermoanaerobaculia bacterium]
MAANVDYLIKLRSGELSDPPSSSATAPDLKALTEIILSLTIHKKKIDVFTMVDTLGTNISSLLPILDTLEQQKLIHVDRSDAHGNYTITPAETMSPRF